MPVQIHELRLSFIAVETYLGMLGDSPPEEAPYAFLGRQATFARRFEDIQKKQPAAGKLRLPWKDTKKKSFWYYHFEKRLAGAKGDEAWKRLAPFRRPLPLGVTAEWLSGNIALYGYFFPFGQALVVTFTVRPDAADRMELHGVVNLALRIKRGGEYRMASDDADVTMNLEQLMDRGLDILRAEAQGPDPEPGRPSDDQPFSIVTVIRGEGVEFPEPVPNPPIDEAMQRVLWALSSWSPQYKVDALQSYSDMSVRIKRGSPACHVLYGDRRGRAVWFPHKFVNPQENQFHSLGVYHRNLLDCSLQVEGLCGLIQEVARVHRPDSPLLEPLRGVAKNAASQASCLYGGSKNTYKTWSAHNQMAKKDGFFDDLNWVRQKCRLSPFTP